ncbi:hypothetical protein HELRODRAFT_168159 [Helobdella robusta]|uniref:Polycomb group protein ASXL3 n=1 Tax=Helobdella robusta TaxID=6412 RepID=T1F088_HELRO|nr:hypothetical protein HELRODRAFT_168159 [Helobdella robusta]ESO09200.1 hypothetical protein HELRODRAFT_168159 [Helobdella robusta]
MQAPLSFLIRIFSLSFSINTGIQHSAFVEWTKVMEKFPGVPLTSKEIWYYIEKENLKDLSCSSTPQASLNSMLHANSKGTDALFYKVIGRSGLYGLANDIPEGATIVEMEDEVEDSCDDPKTSATPLTTSADDCNNDYANFLLNNNNAPEKKKEKITLVQLPSNFVFPVILMEPPTAENSLDITDSETSNNSSNTKSSPTLDDAVAGSTIIVVVTSSASDCNTLASTVTTAATITSDIFSTASVPSSSTLTSNKLNVKDYIIISNCSRSTNNDDSIFDNKNNKKSRKSSSVCIQSLNHYKKRKRKRSMMNNNSLNEQNINQHLKKDAQEVLYNGDSQGTTDSQESTASIIKTTSTTATITTTTNATTAVPSTVANNSATTATSTSNEILTNDKNKPQDISHQSDISTIKSYISNSVLSSSKMRKRSQKLSMAAQIQKSRLGCVDLRTPNSFLVNINLKSLLNKHTFSMLPGHYQEELSKLLPSCDQTVIDGAYRLANNTALSNEFFTKACMEWRERLQDGEFTTENQSKRKHDDKDSNKLDPWKEKHFEASWGEKLSDVLDPSSLNVPPSKRSPSITSSSFPSSFSMILSTTNECTNNVSSATSGVSASRHTDRPISLNLRSSTREISQHDISEACIIYDATHYVKQFLFNIILVISTINCNCIVHSSDTYPNCKYANNYVFLYGGIEFFQVAVFSSLAVVTQSVTSSSTNLLSLYSCPVCSSLIPTSSASLTTTAATLSPIMSVNDQFSCSIKKESQNAEEMYQNNKRAFSELQHSDASQDAKRLKSFSSPTRMELLQPAKTLESKYNATSPTPANDLSKNLNSSFSSSSASSLSSPQSKSPPYMLTATSATSPLQLARKLFGSQNKQISAPYMSPKPQNQTRTLAQIKAQNQAKRSAKNLMHHFKDSSFLNNNNSINNLSNSDSMATLDGSPTQVAQLKTEYISSSETVELAVKSVNNDGESLLKTKMASTDNTSITSFASEEKIQSSFRLNDESKSNSECKSSSLMFSSYDMQSNEQRITNSSSIPSQAGSISAVIKTERIVQPSSTADESFLTSSLLKESYHDFRSLSACTPTTVTSSCEMSKLLVPSKLSLTNSSTELNKQIFDAKNETILQSQFHIPSTASSATKSQASLLAAPLTSKSPNSLQLAESLTQNSTSSFASSSSFIAYESTPATPSAGSLTSQPPVLPKHKLKIVRVASSGGQITYKVENCIVPVSLPETSTSNKDSKNITSSDSLLSSSNPTKSDSGSVDQGLVFVSSSFPYSQPFSSQSSKKSPLASTFPTKSSVFVSSSKYQFKNSHPKAATPLSYFQNQPIFNEAKLMNNTKYQRNASNNQSKITWKSTYGELLLRNNLENSVDCTCNLKAFVICSKCGAFCHNECIGPSKMCITCLITT